MCDICKLIRGICNRGVLSATYFWASALRIRYLRPVSGQRRCLYETCNVLWPLTYTYHAINNHYEKE
jgi:hypothetical protein